MESKNGGVAETWEKVEAQASWTKKAKAIVNGLISQTS